MDRVIGEGQRGYRDMSATEFKKAFGETLEQALRGRRIRITRHGRTGDRIVIMREADLKELEARAVSPLDALRAEFDGMVETMQQQKARDAVASVGTASTEELGKAAVNEFTADG
jgi:antitoxin (DNA-binding transcriptional repressor) of toxin-antitoxin stability system